MVLAELYFTLPVGPDDAFRLLSDPVMDPRWQSACVAAWPLGGAAAGPRQGGRYEVTFAVGGQAMTFTVLLTRCEPGVHSEFTTTDGPFRLTGAYQYAARADGGTDVHWACAVDPGRYFGILPAALLKKLFVAQVRRDSARLAARLAAGAYSLT